MALAHKFTPVVRTFALCIAADLSWRQVWGGWDDSVKALANDLPGVHYVFVPVLAGFMRSTGMGITPSKPIIWASRRKVKAGQMAAYGAAIKVRDPIAFRTDLCCDVVRRTYVSSLHVHLSRPLPTSSPSPRPRESRPPLLIPILYPKQPLPLCLSPYSLRLIPTDSSPWL